MPRAPRIETAEAVHHVTAKSVSGRLLFRDDDDRRRYLALLAETVESRAWSVRSYCQMTNHLHLLVQTPREDLGLGMKAVHEEFAVFVNRKYGESGHLFGSRFNNKLVRSERHLVGCLRYIARNPVEAGMRAVASEWPWSAHRALAGLDEPPAFLDWKTALAVFGSVERGARSRYRELVATSRERLLAELRHEDPDGWLVTATCEYEVAIPELAEVLGVSRRTAYKRLAAARRRVGPVPGSPAASVAA